MVRMMAVILTFTKQLTIGKPNFDRKAVKSTRKAVRSCICSSTFDAGSGFPLFDLQFARRSLSTSILLHFLLILLLKLNSKSQALSIFCLNM